MPGVRFLSCLLKALLPVVGVSVATVSIAVAVRRVWQPWLDAGIAASPCPGLFWGLSSAVLTTYYGAHSVFLPGVVDGSAVAIIAACYSQSASIERRLFRFVSISGWLKECPPGSESSAEVRFAAKSLPVKSTKSQDLSSLSGLTNRKICQSRLIFLRPRYFQVGSVHLADPGLCKSNGRRTLPRAVPICILQKSS